ncbi:MAG: hypothetical protein DRP92_07855 [Candidatus Neomarinimicrobiota bacterium]|nr:MAG: hypothetical protein DRP92_07855 [Candidatus Neomarinimicrobiota bacterium]
MKDRKNIVDEFIDFVPLYKDLKKVALIFIYHFLIFVSIIFLLYVVTSYFPFLAIVEAFLLSTISNGPFIYMIINSDKIREKYLRKYRDNPWQHFFMHYSYTSPFGAAALYFPLMLKTDYLLPPIIDLPQNFLTKTFFPIYIAIPLGTILLVFGLLIIRVSQNFDTDIGNYLHVMCPDKSRIPMKGIYELIRHPRFLSRLVLSVSLGIFANNLLSVLVALAHFIPYYIFMVILDKQLVRIYGKEIEQYQKKTPSLLPRIRNWKRFAKVIIYG